MIEISMPLNREKVKTLLAETNYQTFKVLEVQEAGIKLNVSVDGNIDDAAKEIKGQLKEELGQGFYFAVAVI